MISISRITAFFFLTTLFCSLKGEVAPHSNPVAFTKWLHRDAFVKALGEIPESHYPVVIEAIPLSGDGVAYRILVIAKPDAGLSYRYGYCLSESEFAKKDQENREAGYTLIQQQTVILMPGKRFQAVWVKQGEVFADE